MRELEVGVEYTTIGGKLFYVEKIEQNSHGPGIPGAWCSDRWWRHPRGPNAGKFVGQEDLKDWHHHTDWVKCSPTEPRLEQLELF